MPDLKADTPAPAVCVSRDFYGFDEFMTFAGSNPIFFDDEIEKTSFDTVRSMESKAAR